MIMFIKQRVRLVRPYLDPIEIYSGKYKEYRDREWRKKFENYYDKLIGLIKPYEVIKIIEEVRKARLPE